MKTNKSYTKRLRVTRKGKIVARVPGQNHFNAKEGSRRQMQRRRTTTFSLSNKSRGRFLPSGSKN
jgi:ribosomal protein L35